MNWGQAIVVSFILFAGFICVMIYRMCSQNVDLVRDDYYQTELAYQQHIDKVANAHKSAPVAMNYQAAAQNVTFSLPETLRQGQIHFYRPSNRKEDFNVSIPATHTSEQIVSTTKMARGFWRIKFTWSDGQRDYYSEQDLYL